MVPARFQTFSRRTSSLTDEPCSRPSMIPTSAAVNPACSWPAVKSGWTPTCVISVALVLALSR